MHLLIRKSMASLQHETEGGEAGVRLRRGLNIWHLSAIGVGSTIGAGIFVLTGTAAADFAGPAVSLSFLLAAVACLFAALCYAEFASMIPVAGSAYTYAYATMGEFIAWIIGWNLVLEYLLSVSTVAVGWSGYFTSFLADHHLHLSAAVSGPPLTHDEMGRWLATGGIINLPAVAIVVAVTAVLSLGIKESALINSLMVGVKILVILLVIGAGFFFINPSNWHPYIPDNSGTPGHFGWTGVVRAASLVFFAYIGFDAVSTSAQEARDPRRAVSIGLLTSLIVCTVLYIAMSLVLTGLAPYAMLAVPHPVFVAVDHAGPALSWLKPLVSIGAIVGLASAMLATLYGQIRIFYSMARDGMISSVFSRLHPRTCVPTAGTWYAGGAAALVAGFFPIEVLGELVSIGTLMAFAIVCAGVVVLRYTHPQLPRPFRVRFVIPVGLAGVITCLGLMFSLPADTWIRLAVWLAAGIVIYFGYSYRHSRLRASLRLSAPPNAARPTTRVAE